MSFPPAGRGHVDGKHVHYGKIYWIFAFFREIYMKNTLNFPYQDQKPCNITLYGKGADVHWAFKNCYTG